MLYGEKGYREKCYIGRNVTEGEMLQGETLQGELLQGELSWGETLYIPRSNILMMLSTIMLKVQVGRENSHLIFVNKLTN